MKVRELIKEINKLNVQDKSDVVAFATVGDEEYEFEIIGIHQEGVPYIELEVTEAKNDI